MTSDSTISLVLILLNLQGLQHLFPTFISVNGPWFFTVIMLCYLLLIPYKKAEARHHQIKNWIMLIIIFAFSVIASISGVFYFFGGYIITKLGFNDGKKRNTLFSAILLIIGSCVIRVFGKIVFDGSWLYEDMLALLCRLGAVSIYLFVCSCNDCFYCF